ncbi:Chemotaxis protein CheW [Zhongshania aliphaticivorans]|uniref:Chemotaxis protein CheW n=1 Tax=Zhongshania aliphaticivorans TaxID=1470434 RepID=A0A5S9PPX3_9GAMM|nr:chemotaxis protein CheW [Zhongshania aliphaticivorans]CAA0106248.1 Chemotaxis protein CheW [Zhongshania aliphaticivorans]CAA0106452.1 Chemotaxis protein CheW [Zhongshania aliphaticivorans]
MSESLSFDYLQALAARCREEFTALPSARDNHVVTWSGVGFRVAGQHCVTAMDDIAEVLTEPAVTRLPGVKPWVRGVANVRGRLLPLVDLSAYLNQAAATEQRQRRVLVIEKGEIYLGLIVDEVFGMQHFDAETFRLEGELRVAALAPYIQGCYQYEQHQWVVFRPVQLIEDSNFYTVAA